MRLKIINANLWLGGLLSEPLMDFLKQETPDILLAQEVYSSIDQTLDRRFRSVQMIQESCDFPYVSFSPACVAVLKEGRINAGNAIFSRFPITHENTIFFDVPFGEVPNYEQGSGDYSHTPRNLQHARIQIDRYTLNTFNTQGIWGTDGNDSERRIAMANTIIDQVKDQENVILGGDLNVTPDTRSISILEDHLENPFKSELESTFNIVRKNSPVFRTAVVDYLFISREIKIIQAVCPRVDISDHLPLIATIELC
jgi:endonuclease/exonuclease/phosphatase family metal-dependent hydrolase